MSNNVFPNLSGNPGTTVKAGLLPLFSALIIHPSHSKALLPIKVREHLLLTTPRGYY